MATTTGRTNGRHVLPDLVTVEPETREVDSLSEKAYYLLRDRLITLDLPPGATIDERGLQDELGMGRTPIREALRRLADARLVEVVPRRGMFASHVHLGDLRAISEVRAPLEGHAARLAAQRARPEELDAAAALLDELRADQLRADQLRADLPRADELRAGELRADRPHAGGLRADQPRTDELRAGELRADQPRADESRADESRADQAGVSRRELIRLDQRVHRLVHRATHNPFLAATLEEYYVHSLRLWFLVLDHLPHLEHAVGEHVELLTAIHDRDASAAERLARRHVSDFENKIRVAL